MNTRLTLASLLLAAGSLVIAPAAMADGKFFDNQRHDRYERSHDRGHYDDRHHKALKYREAHRDRKRHERRKLRDYYWEHRRYDRRWHHDRDRYLGHRHDRRYRNKVIIIKPRHHHHHSGLSGVTGGIIGGMVGNAISDGDPVATTMGAVMGTVVGSRVGRH